jgi:hypothetical protein
MALVAQAQNVPYAVETFLGPTAGKQWQPLNTYVAGINAQTGTTYTVLGSDMGKLITFNNAGAIAVTLPRPERQALRPTKVSTC